MQRCGHRKREYVGDPAPQSWCFCRFEATGQLCVPIRKDNSWTGLAGAAPGWHSGRDGGNCRSSVLSCAGPDDAIGCLSVYLLNLLHLSVERESTRRAAGQKRLAGSGCRGVRRAGSVRNTARHSRIMIWNGCTSCKARLASGRLLPPESQRAGRDGKIKKCRWLHAHPWAQSGVDSQNVQNNISGPGTQLARMRIAFSTMLQSCSLP